MSTQSITKKRKSVDDAQMKSKKVKTTKPAEKSAPLKSALKKSKDGAKIEKRNASKAKPAQVVEEEVEETVNTRKASPEIEDAAEGGAELTADQTAALIAGFSSSEDESSDDEEAGISVKKLSHAPRIKEIQKTIKDATSSDPERSPGVIYIGHVPHGFFEPQMKAYFSQFGEILHLRLARNRKTGKSQHYAFIEFASAAVAEIVAKTMDKYLLFGHILQVRMVPREQVKENMWDKSGKRKKVAPRNKIEGGRLRRGMVREDWQKRVGKEERRRKSKAEKLAELEYDFEMPEVKKVESVPIKPKEIEAAPENVEEVEPVLVETKVSETVLEAPPPEEEKVAAVLAGKKRSSTGGKPKKTKKVKA